MRHVARIATLGTLATAALFAGVLTSVAQASFGTETFEAGTCINNTCTYASVEANHSEAATQAASHPAWGITKFTMKTSGSNAGEALRRIRVDVPPGLAANPEAPMPKCSVAQFNANPKGCPASSEVGTIEMEATLEVLPGAPLPLPKLTGIVYNLEAPASLPLDFGINVEPAGELVTPVRLFLEGHVDWSGDYHEYFEIHEVPREAGATVLGLTVNRPLRVLMSKLNFNGHAGGNFLTIPSVCSSTTTSHLELESYAGEIARMETRTPVGVEGCGNVPFEPTATVTSETATSDQPDGVTTVVKAPQHAGTNEINTADIRDAHVTLPEGMTLNPSAANGLDVCTAGQIAIGTTNPVTCPAASKIGTVTIETVLPPKSLSGGVYLGSPSGGSITGPPYTIYLDAESTSGVSVRLQGTVTPSSSTGRLEATFLNNPQLTFSELVLSLNGGPRAPLANPLVCGNTSVDSLFTPYTGGAAALSSSPFTTSGCPNLLPFALGQSTQSANATAGAYSSYTFNLSRADGQQYLSRVSTTLPAGLLGAIPSVALCGEPQAARGTCAATSAIGTATVTAGAGSEPVPFSGPVYLTGPYNGAPYGLSIPVVAAVGHFNLGTVMTRATISVDPHTARVTVATVPPGAPGALPTIVGGVPVRLKTLRVEVNRADFIFNPTNCSALATESTLSSTFNATQPLSSPFQVGNCNSLPFKPTFKISTNAKTSKLNGASLQVSLTQGAHQANMHSVFVSLPKQLPSRLTTLQKACPEATFTANPVACRPLGSEVGMATVTTPVLPGELKGSAYLVSHGGEAFPDLDLVLEGDGVKVILVGNTTIKGGITSSTFAAIPDVPVTSFALNLPVGPHSILTAIGGLCAKALMAPTTILAQSGAQLKQNTRISVSSCPVQILSHRVSGHKLVLKIRTFAAGRVSVTGKDLQTIYRRFGKATTITLKVPISRAGLRALSKHGRLKIKVRVGFVPKQRSESVSAASVRATFR
jgi:hypothetical protein